jgi:uncharacterized protein YbcV (DUF1398 family)
VPTRFPWPRPPPSFSLTDSARRQERFVFVDNFSRSVIQWQSTRRDLKARKQHVAPGNTSHAAEGDSMDTTAITAAAAATLTGTMAFPAVVAQLMTAGVEYYHVDYVGRAKHFSDGVGGHVVTAIMYEELPAVAADLDVDALRANIRDSQQNGQHYRDFTVRAMKAGVQGYFAFLRGRRVTYFGRTGDQHTEWFPGAAPKRS